MSLYPIQIELTKRQVRDLKRAIGYGKSAISIEEWRNGEGDRLTKSLEKIDAKMDACCGTK